MITFLSLLVMQLLHNIAALSRAKAALSVTSCSMARAAPLTDWYHRLCCPLLIIHPELIHVVCCVYAAADVDKTGGAPNLAVFACMPACQLTSHSCRSVQHTVMNLRQCWVTTLMLHRLK